MKNFIVQFLKYLLSMLFVRAMAIKNEARPKSTGPLVVIPLIVIPGLLIQFPMAKLAKEGMREGALRNAILVKTIEGTEDIKALQAEPYFQRQWEQTHEVSAAVGIKQRMSLIVWLTLVGMIVMLVWAYFAILDEATVGTGKVTPSSRAQLIESLDGGIVNELLP